jgi:hypothetical protein
MSKDEALKLALEDLIYASSYCDTYDAIDAVRQALAEPVQQKPLFVELIAQHPGLAEELKAIDEQPLLIPEPVPQGSVQYLKIMMQESAFEGSLELSDALANIDEFYVSSQEPCGWQFYQDGKWHNGMETNNHRKNTEDAGFPVRDVYPSPQMVVSLTDEEQKNAARYQWLRNPNTNVSLVLDKRTEWVETDETVSGVGGYWIYEYRAGEELDVAIDAAMKATYGIDTIIKGNKP